MLSKTGTRSCDLRLGRYVKLFFVNTFYSIRIFLSNPSFPKCTLRQIIIGIFNHEQLNNQYSSILTHFFLNSMEEY